MQVQQLNFGSWLNTAEHNVAHAAGQAGHAVLSAAERCAASAPCRAEAARIGERAAIMAMGLQNLNMWDDFKHGAETFGNDALHGAEQCAGNAHCRATVAKAGEAAAKRWALQNLNFWDDFKSGAEQVGNDALHGAEQCAGDAHCRSTVAQAGEAAWKRWALQNLYTTNVMMI